MASVVLKSFRPRLFQQRLEIHQTRGRFRGPPRFLGYTKSQYLDFLMRTNAGICMLSGLAVFPIFGFWVYRYVTVSKPSGDAYREKERERLLSEGKAIA